MIKKLAAFFISVLVLGTSAQAQDASSPTKGGSSSKTHTMPNIPGSFLLELGLNEALNRPDKFNIGFWGSRALNIYYQYDMRILKSKFSFHPGIGFGLERYKFTNNLVPFFDQNHNLSMDLPLGITGVKKAQLITNYLDIPLELRFSTNPEDPTRSFKISIGGRVGYLFESHTKLKYTDNGDRVKLKNKEALNLNPFRYGIYMKVGGGNFSIFGYYNLSPVFKSGLGPVPQGTSITPKDMNNFTVGISLSSF